LLLSESQGERLTRFEVTNILSTLFAAAHESTTNLISNGILALLRYPDQLAVLRRDPGVIRTLVEEVLRYDPPVHLVARAATEPRQIGDIDVEPGTIICLLLAAANRDPAEFPEPDKFDVTRQPKRQALSFGAGSHFCVGSALAKLEAEIALSAFAERLNEPELDEDSLVYRRHIVVRGLKRTIVHFRPQRA
jgi:cytochrome P450